MGKIQTGLAETGQKIKIKLPTEDYRSSYNLGDEGPEGYVVQN